MRTKPKTKTKRAWLIPVSILFALTVYIVVLYLLQQQEEDKAKFTFYPNFNIEIPTGYKIHGIDVSTYQNIIYWPAVKKMNEENVQIGFTFIKATEGLSNTDKQFKRNWLQAKLSGIPRGAYHYFLATKDGKLQANNFIKQVKLEPGDLPPVLDVEELYGVQPQLMKQRVLDWLQTVEAVYKVKPIIYTSADFYNRYLGKDFDEYPLWVAHYFEKYKPRVDRNWQFWQHGSTAHVNGITSTVDINVFNGDSLDFRRMLIQ